MTDRRPQRSARRRVAARALALLAFLPTGCASATYTSVRFDRAPELAEIEDMEPGASTLGDCLALLGAPVAVEQDREHGAILTWSWTRANGWAFGLSLPLFRSASTSFRYSRDDQRPNRLRIRFDADWQILEISREGEGAVPGSP